MEQGKISRENNEEEPDSMISSSLIESFEKNEDQEDTIEIEKIVSPELAKALEAVPKEERKTVQRLFS